MAVKIFTQEEKEAYSEQQKLIKADIFEKLENGVKAVYESDKYKIFLSVMSKFHNYSFNNTMLIAMQKPDATLCAGLTTWNKNGRSVNKGEKGLVVLAPCKKVIKEKDETTEELTTEKVLIGFKLVKTFDISQTNGKPLPSLCDELAGTVEQKDKILSALEKITAIPFEFKPISGDSKGYFISDEHKIVIKQDMSELQTIKTAIHETAHAVLHDTGAEAEKSERHIKEIQAESVAYVVSSAIGLDTSDYSFAYVASWSKDKDIKDLKGNFDIIQKTSDKLITAINSEIKLTRSSSDLEKAFQQEKKKGLNR